MSATTVTGQVRSDQASTHTKRNAVIVFTIIGLFALSFFVGRLTATTHVASSAQVATHTQLSPADRALVANDIAPITPTYVEVAPNGEQLSPADRALVANDIAPITPTYVEVAPNGEQLSPANRALVANDIAPITPTYVEVAPNGEQLSPADRALVANDIAPVAQLSQANTTACIAGRPC